MLQKRCSIFFCRLLCRLRAKLLLALAEWRPKCSHSPFAHTCSSSSLEHVGLRLLCPPRGAFKGEGFFFRWDLPIQGRRTQKDEVQNIFSIVLELPNPSGRGGVRNVKRSLVGLRDGDVLKRGDLPRAVVVYPLSPSKADFKTLVRRVHVSSRLNGSRLTESMSK